MPITAYPLTWPALFPRTPERDRKTASFGKKNRDRYGIKRLSVPAGSDRVLSALSAYTRLGHTYRCDPDTPTQFAPSAEAVLQYLRGNNITGGQAARMMYLSGSNQVRKYTGGAKPRQMDGARWFCLHAHHILSAEQIAKVEAAMTADLTP